MSLLSRRMMMAIAEMEEEGDMAQWKVSGEEYELAEDIQEWTIELPGVTEIFAVFLPYGTTANSSASINAGAKVSDGLNTIDFANTFVGVISNTADKIWRKTGVHIVTEDGMIYEEVVQDSGFWDFVSGAAKTPTAFIPRSTDLSSVTTFTIAGYGQIGAGSKLKIWAK